jgi:hypothetical protein
MKRPLNSVLLLNDDGVRGLVGPMQDFGAVSLSIFSGQPTLTLHVTIDASRARELAALLVLAADAAEVAHG